MRGGLKQLLFPTACPICGSLKDQAYTEESGLCRNCAEKYLNKKQILIMPAFVPDAVAAICPAFYGEGLRDAMRRFKFSGETYIGECFGTMIYKAICAGCKDLDFDIVTCVPLSEERFAERGFNQSEEVAKIVAKLACIPFAQTLTRNMQGRSQSSLLTEERQEKEGLFDNLPSINIRNKSILLTDDIITTGSTLAECSRILKEAGASSVAVAAVAGGRKEFI